MYEREREREREKKKKKKKKKKKNDFNGGARVSESLLLAR